MNLLNSSINKTSKTPKKTKIIDWSSSLEDLLGKASLKSIEKLNSVGIKEVWDLLWVFPLRVLELPPLRSFEFIEEGRIFIGRGKVLNVQAKPNFRVRGRGKAMLYNISVHVQDTLSDKIISLKWFNSYGSVTQKISQCEYIEFMGEASIFNGQSQFANPDFFQLEAINSESPFVTVSNELKIQYPTINTVSGVIVKKIIDKISINLWNNIPETLPESLIKRKNFLSLSESFKVIHAKIKPTPLLESRAQNRLIYEEFFEDQIKIFLRRQFFKKPKAISYSVDENTYQKFCARYPYTLTIDQSNTINDVRTDLSAEHPMMRLVQGDVGCGKTTIAMIAAMIVIENGAQAALMCPTEALAIQHFSSCTELFETKEYNVRLILGSTPAKEKKQIQKDLEDGTIDFIIGTHSLIQDSIQFKKLGLAIIDEQHKFGVDQRIRLTSKSEGTHCLIMSATPIPRSLSLTQYGDLDISTIKVMPSGRKGHKTRIVTKENFQQFLSFVMTRLSLKEQIYVVVPAINESVEIEQDFHNLTDILERFKKYFPDYIVEGLHGKMKSDEKAIIFSNFKNHKINILVSTSVIEVGINVINASVMAIMNPERFGLSSLHQLRGRVGRGDKPGFCFLVNDKIIAVTSMERLKVIENNSDGFKIAEEDLKFRGEGDLFGTDQSGSQTQKRLANIILHADILYEAREDALKLIQNNDPDIEALLMRYSQDERIFSTV
ncbi:MAG: ATP-dependent DNA helicase RecG [Bacteriovorax sp.]|nr:ATP-dependent DNA helicase RecG [Bacteriovorax sp.]